MTEEIKIEDGTADLIQIDVVAEKSNAYALELRTKSTELVITEDDGSSWNAVDAIRLSAKQGMKAVKEHLKEHIARANAKHKKLTAIQNELCAPYEEIESDCKDKQNEFTREQERKRLEAERIRQAAERARQAQIDEDRRNAEELHRKRVEEAKAKDAPPPPPPAPIPEPIPDFANIAPTPVVVPKRKGSTERRRTKIVSVQDMFLAYATGENPLPAFTEKDLDDLGRILKHQKLADALGDGFKMAGVVSEKYYT